jgi:integrase/recombinase XerD
VSRLAPVIEGFFTTRLTQRRATPATVAAYRDTFRLLLDFAQRRTGRPPSQLDVGDIDAELVGAFLEHLEAVRANSVRTRNLRLTAIHSLFSYAALRCPEHSETIRRVLAIPAKRADTTLVSFLTPTETTALLSVIDRDSPLGERDHLLIAIGVQTGLRVSELTALVFADISHASGAHVRTRGKGRKERITPLTRSTTRLLQDYQQHRRAGPTDPVFAGRLGGRLSTDAVKDLLDKHVRAAAIICPSLAAKTVTPHTLRHTCAMNMLQAGIDIATIALWLGHASTKATQVYLHADLALKEHALARTAPTPIARKRYRPPDSLLAFLETL